MSKIDVFIEALKKNGDGRYHYYRDSDGSGLGCSDYVKLCLREAKIISITETFWAGQGQIGVLADTSRFEKLSASATKKLGDILWYHNAHVSVYAGGNDIYEASPESTHGICSNGKTGVGLWKNHTYNCAGIPLTCIYRIKEDEMTRQEYIDGYMKEAERIANDNSHGYDNRVNHNLGNPDFDCGAFVSACLRKVGLLTDGEIFEPNSATGTWGYDTLLTKAGFQKQSFDYNSVQRGDVLIKSGQHTELAYGNNKQIGAHHDTDGKQGDSKGDEISIKALSDYWDYMYRLKSDEKHDVIPTTVLQKGSSGSLVKTLQTILNNKINAGLEVDGSFGDLTLKAVKDYQTKYGLQVDGYVGKETWTSLYAEEKGYVTLNAKEKCEVAAKVCAGDFGNDPRRKETLVKLYGTKVAQQIQDIINIVYEN